MKVLLIDDEPDIRQIAELALRVVGKMDTVVAASAEQGIAMAASESPDVILLDMMMPGLDGLTALQRLRQRSETRDIPVIFMTAKVQPSDVQLYVERGALGVVQKPFDPMTLADQVTSLLGAVRREPSR